MKIFAKSDRQISKSLIKYLVRLTHGDFLVSLGRANNLIICGSGQIDLNDIPRTSDSNSSPQSRHGFICSAHAYFC